MSKKKSKTNITTKREKCKEKLLPLRYTSITIYHILTYLSLVHDIGFFFLEMHFGTYIIVVYYLYTHRKHPISKLSIYSS